MPITGKSIGLVVITGGLLLAQEAHSPRCASASIPVPRQRSAGRARSGPARRRPGHRIHRHPVRPGGRETGRRRRAVFPESAAGRASNRNPHATFPPRPRARTSISAGQTISSASTSPAAGRDFRGDAVFVGHGIAAPEYQWDDYKGVDVQWQDSAAVHQRAALHDPKFFEGRALTYYGRWTYKYEEGRARARAVILIHTTPTAGYSWDVVRSSWGRETPYVKLAPGGKRLRSPVG